MCIKVNDFLFYFLGERVYTILIWSGGLLSRRLPNMPVYTCTVRTVCAVCAGEYAGGLAADKKGVGDAAGTGKRRKADLADLLNLAESAVQAKDIHRS